MKGLKGKKRGGETDSSIFKKNEEFCLFCDGLTHYVAQAILQPQALMCLGFQTPATMLG